MLAVFSTLEKTCLDTFCLILSKTSELLLDIQYCLRHKLWTALLSLLDVPSRLTVNHLQLNVIYGCTVSIFDSAVSHGKILHLFLEICFQYFTK